MEHQTNIVGGPKASATGPGPEIMAADTLEGNDVYNAAGEELGSIKDIMIDVPRGRVAYAVLSRGGILGMGDKLFAIPWAALTLDTDRKCFVPQRRQRKILKNAPGFARTTGHGWPGQGFDPGPA